MLGPGKLRLLVFEFLAGLPFQRPETVAEPLCRVLRSPDPRAGRVHEFQDPIGDGGSLLERGLLDVCSQGRLQATRGGNLGYVLGTTGSQQRVHCLEDSNRWRRVAAVGISRLVSGKGLLHDLAIAGVHVLAQLLPDELLDLLAQFVEIELGSVGPFYLQSEDRIGVEGSGRLVWVAGWSCRALLDGVLVLELAGIATPPID